MILSVFYIFGDKEKYVDYPHEKRNGMAFLLKETFKFPKDNFKSMKYQPYELTGEKAEPDSETTVFKESDASSNVRRKFKN